MSGMIHRYEEEYGKWGRIKRGKLTGSLVVLLLAECARSEGARSTAAVGPTRVPFQEREASELGRIIWKDERRPMRAVKDSLATP